MPIYEYHCRDCEKHFEAILLSRGEQVSCPSCASAAIEKQLSVFSSPGAHEEQSSGTGGGCGSCSPGGCGCH
jgi:putative FmdB family regulatory protein